MNIIPVLDLLHGQVVRGVGGQRQEYRPIVSVLTASAQPLDVARAFYEHFGLSRFYVADLDAIEDGPPALALYEKLQGAGFHLWVDAGVRSAVDVSPLLEARVDRIIAGLETLAGPAALAALIEKAGAEHIIFSLDLKNGAPLCRPEDWPVNMPLQIAYFAISVGIKKIIILDLAQVGMNNGTGTEEICAALLREHPEVEVIAGGGVRGLSDLQRLKEAGLAGVLAASALHDGRISAADLQKL